MAFQSKCHQAKPSDVKPRIPKGFAQKFVADPLMVLNSVYVRGGLSHYPAQKIHGSNLNTC